MGVNLPPAPLTSAVQNQARSSSLHPSLSSAATWQCSQMCGQCNGMWGVGFQPPGRCFWRRRRPALHSLPHLSLRGHLRQSLVIPNQCRGCIPPWHACGFGGCVAFLPPQPAWEQLDLILPACLPSSTLPLISSSKVLACLDSPRSLVTLESLPLLSLMKECLIRYKQVLCDRRQNPTLRQRSCFSLPPPPLPKGERWQSLAVSR